MVGGLLQTHQLHIITTIPMLLQVGEWLVVRLVSACPNLTNLSLGMHTSLTDTGLRKILASNRSVAPGQVAWLTRREPN